jgi:saccharopine dehydrogenase-like NADP-dependent oxidoreductase
MPHVITIVGAGPMGSATARELVNRDDVAEVRVCDAGPRVLRDLRSRVDDPKLRSFQVDARDPGMITPVIQGSACVIGCADPSLNPGLARVSIDVGAHFCDLGGGDALIREVLALDDAARERSVWVLPGCGLAPGLVNVLCLLGLEKFESASSAHLRVGTLPQHPEPPFNFRVGFSAGKLLDDYTNPSSRIEGGEVVAADPLSDVERISFGTPFEDLEAFCTAGSLTTLAEELSGTLATLDMKTIAWPGHADHMRVILGLGLGDDRIIDVRTHLTYRDVLARRLTKRLGGDHADVVLLRVLVTGRANGADRTFVFEMEDRYEDAAGLSAMSRCTSIPTASVACLLARGVVPGTGGARPPEAAVPGQLLFDDLVLRGLQIKSFWYDGHRSVENPHRPDDA